MGLGRKSKTKYVPIRIATTSGTNLIQFRLLRRIRKNKPIAITEYTEVKIINLMMASFVERKFQAPSSSIQRLTNAGHLSDTSAFAELNPDKAVNQKI